MKMYKKRTDVLGGHIGSYLLIHNVLKGRKYELN